MDSSCVEKYAESGFGRLQPPAIPPKPGFGRLQPKQFLQNPVLSDCSPNNSFKTRFWAIAARTIPPKPGFGRLQPKQFLQNPVLGNCNPNNSFKTRFWAIAALLRTSIDSDLWESPPPLWPTRCGAALGGRGGKKMKKTSIINQAIVQSRPLNSTSNGIGAT